MVIKELRHNDGFDKLLKTQSEFELPVGMEDRLMQRIESEVKTSKLTFKISPIINIGILASVLFCLSILSMYYDTLTKYIGDIQLTLVLTIVVYALYELNAAMPSVLYYLQHRKAKLI